MAIREPLPPLPDTSALWATFAADRCSCHRTQLIEIHYPIVRRIAGRVRRRLPDQIDLEDVVSFGTIGLIKAIDVYDPYRCNTCGHRHGSPEEMAGGVRVITRYVVETTIRRRPRRSNGHQVLGHVNGCEYGWPMRESNGRWIAQCHCSEFKQTRFEVVARAHIEGHILDEIRSADWAPRSVRRRQREVEETTERLAVELHRDPTRREIANALKTTDEDIALRQRDVAVARLASLDEPVREDGFGIEIEAGANGFEAGELALIGERVLRSLPLKQQAVIAMYYFEDMGVEDIATALHTTDAQVTRYHSEGIAGFRSLLADQISSSI